MIGTGIDKAVPLNTSNNYVPKMDKRFYFHFQIIEIYIHKIRKTVFKFEFTLFN